MTEFVTPASVAVSGGHVPPGGTTGQVVSKLSATDFDTGWVTVTGSGGAVTGASGDEVIITGGGPAPTGGYELWVDLSAPPAVTGGTSAVSLTRVTGDWIIPLGQAVVNNMFANSGVMYVAPWIADATFMTTDVACVMNTAVANVLFRGVIYSDTGGGWPNALLFDTGQLSFNGTVGTQSVTGSVSFTAGQVYWLGGVSQNGVTAQPRGIGTSCTIPIALRETISTPPPGISSTGGVGVLTGSVTGVPPSTWPALGPGNAHIAVNVPVIVLRVA